MPISGLVRSYDDIIQNLLIDRPLPFQTQHVSRMVHQVVQLDQILMLVQVQGMNVLARPDPADAKRLVDAT
jgi:hypothetical protein